MAAAQEPPVPADLKRIDLSTSLDRDYWSNRLEASPAQLERAVREAGSDVDVVVAWLRQHAANE